MADDQEQDDNPQSDKIPDGITRDDVLNAIADIDAGVNHEFGPSTGYDLIHEGRPYPPKAIVGLAARRIIGRVLTPYDFKGGEGSRCFRVLRNLGFEVVPKRDAVPARTPFAVGQEYTRDKIYKIMNVPDEQRRGNWETGYNRWQNDLFVFSTVGSAATGGYDYDNGWEDGGIFRWYAKEGTRLNQPLMKWMLHEANRVFVFTRPAVRKPFTFQGVATAVSWEDTSPVLVRWQVDRELTATPPLPPRPPMWQMVREAVDHLPTPASNEAIRGYVNEHWDDVNPGTLNNVITTCCVNDPSRINQPENSKPRFCDSNYDFLYRVGRGLVERYVPDHHGYWELKADASGKTIVASAGTGATYLLTWTPAWNWPDGYEAIVQRSINGETIKEPWGTGNNKSIGRGERVFLLRQRTDRGIVGSGWTTSKSYDDEHWDGSEKQIHFVDAAFDRLVALEDRLPVETLIEQIGEYDWNHVLASGNSMPDAVAVKVEQLWAKHLRTVTEPELPEEVRSPQKYPEGTTKRIVVNAYERNPKARAACVDHYGAVCVVCGFCFADVYGPLGDGYIHVHHLRDLASIGESYEVDPVADLSPVCPNCHAMLHHKTKLARSIEDLKRIMAALHDRGSV